MATGRDTAGSAGLGELHLDTRSGGATTTEQRFEREDSWAQLAAQLEWEQRCAAAEPANAPPLLSSKEALLDALPPNSFAVSNAALTTNAEFKAPPAAWEVPGPLTFPGSADELRPPAEGAPAAARRAPDATVDTDAAVNALRRESPSADDLPTGPSLLDRSADAPRVLWRTKAQQRGLYSAFVTAADDFSRPAAGPSAAAVAASLMQSTSAPPLPASEPAALPAARPRAEEAVTNRPRSAEPSPNSGPSVAATETGELLAAAPPQTSQPQSSPLGEPGRMFRALQRPRAAASQPVEPGGSSPAPPLEPPAGSTLSVEVTQVVKQSLQRGQRLLRQLLRLEGESAAVAPPSGSRPPERAAAPSPTDKKKG